tara:strand:+ start:370 stop:591 length:222 start_codon:yes stop_codon:yes gene_type:complete
MTGGHFADEIEKIAGFQVRGGRGATGPKGGVPLGITRPRRSSSGVGMKGFNHRMKKAIKGVKKPSLGTLGSWG